MTQDAVVKLALTRLAGDAASVSARAASVLLAGSGGGAQALGCVDDLADAVAEMVGLIKALQNRGLIADKPVLRSRAYGDAASQLDRAVARVPVLSVVARIHE